MSTQKVAVNFAEEAQLTTLKGVGKATAHNIMKFRAGNITKDTISKVGGIHMSTDLSDAMDFEPNPALIAQLNESGASLDTSPRTDKTQPDIQIMNSQKEVINKLER